MSLSPISHVTPAPVSPELQKPVAAPAAQPEAPAAVKSDSVTISLAGHAAADGDGDGS